MDDLYIRRVLNGDRDAFKYLVRGHQDLAMRTAMSIVKNEVYAQEIVQSSFLQAYESLETFRGDAQFSTWFCRIVINKSLRHLQKNKRHKQENLVVQVNSEVIFNQGLLDLKKEDLADLLRKAMQALKPKESLVIQLFYLEEYQVNEIEQITGYTKSNVKVLLHRGRKHLHQILLEKYENLK